MKNIVIGIDISKKTLDLCIKEQKNVTYHAIENNISSIRRFFKTYARQEVIVAMENTGRYNWNLYEVLPDFNFTVYVISPLHLKKSMGLVRGKNDKIDALRICNFIEKNNQEIPIWRPCSKSIKTIKVLLAERAIRVKIKRQLVGQQSDYKLMKSTGLENKLSKLNKSLIKDVNLQIKVLEESIEDVIAGDEKLKEQQGLIKSVPGVGKVLSWMVLSKTEGFTTIADPRKMACYSGVVPFDFQSGSSIRKRPGVSMYADKSLKSILHLAAMSAIRLKNELAIYYNRKVTEGKSKMSVLNAVRNKIIHRIFAVIKKQIPYQNNLVLS